MVRLSQRKPQPRGTYFSQETPWCLRADDKKEQSPSPFTEEAFTRPGFAVKAELRMCLKHNRMEEMIYSGVTPNLEKKITSNRGTLGLRGDAAKQLVSTHVTIVKVTCPILIPGTHTGNSGAFD